jgi:hypothetical protein
VRVVVVVAGAGFAGRPAPVRLRSPVRSVEHDQAPAGAWAGLMEGALRSGARAADEVLIHAIA